MGLGLLGLGRARGGWRDRKGLLLFEGRAGLVAGMGAGDAGAGGFGRRLLRRLRM